jgi:hypothetical protein
MIANISMLKDLMELMGFTGVYWGLMGFNGM